MIVTIMILTCSICIEYTVFIKNIALTMHNSTSGLCVCVCMIGSITLYNDKKYLITIVTCVTWEDFLIANTHNCRANCIRNILPSGHENEYSKKIKT